MSWYTEKQDVTSSSIKTLYFDEPTKVVVVEFHNGSFAGYDGISSYGFRNWVNAPSVGKFYNAYVRGVHKGVGIEGEMQERDNVVVPLTNAIAIHESSRASSGSAGSSRSMHSVPQQVERVYTVRGYVLIEETYDALSPEDAVQQFSEDYDDVAVKEVVVSFE